MPGPVRVVSVQGRGPRVYCKISSTYIDLPNGIWEFCIDAIYLKEPLQAQRLININSNLVLGDFIAQNGRPQTRQASLAMCQIGGGTQFVRLPERFFEINNNTGDRLTLEVENLVNEEQAVNVMMGFQLLFRRKS